MSVGCDVIDLGIVPTPTTQLAAVSVLLLDDAGNLNQAAAFSVFLAGEDASYITGIAVTVDGGVTAATGQVSFSRLIGE